MDGIGFAGSGDGADMTDRDWVACRLARETGVRAASARAWVEATAGRKA
jgi:hypothetical protein